MAKCLADSVAVSERDTMMPVVPMFHVNAWGLPWAAAFSGASLVLVGPRPDAVVARRSDSVRTRDT